MSTNKQALRNSADRDWFEEWFKKEYHPNKTGPYIKDQMFFAIQAARAPLLDELEAAEKRIAELEKGHCGAPLLDREEAHVKTVSGLLAELGRWQQESSTWQSVAEKQLAIAIEADKRIAELEAREVELPPLVDTSNVPFAAHTWNCYRAEAVKAIRAAGITVKGE